ncbi:hypothetical protein WHI96_12375 [Pseudonocardia tropica]|uniref:Thiolase N-terminal domain-containing protein n=1 Tax=Pseudonocardia tropica TaxID=681289 RepID=A0ABV1JXJ4_9PSEU
MRDAVIVEVVRSPVGEREGGRADVRPTDLSAHLPRSLVERSGVDPAHLGDVIRGCVSQVGGQTFDLGRDAAPAAGFPGSEPPTPTAARSRSAVCWAVPVRGS